MIITSLFHASSFLHSSKNYILPTNMVSNHDLRSSTMLSPGNKAWLGWSKNSIDGKDDFSWIARNEGNIKTK